VTRTSPRLLVVMGSGETAPTMVTLHRQVAARFADAPRAVLLDTPYGFQENAAEISARAVDYFARRVQLLVEVAGFPGFLAADPVQRGDQPSPAALARLRAADLVFSGPGSPTYALAAWRGSAVVEALATKLAHGGAVVVSSAAAVTIGRFSLPVYEIYKAGHELHWLDGLDLLAPFGFSEGCVVVPHFDNAEGGTHDTRFCYMGERRLALLETMLPQAAWVLGVDEHTGLVIDLGAGQARVLGRGAVTVRWQGHSRRFADGACVPLAELARAARDLACRPAAAPPATSGSEAGGRLRASASAPAGSDSLDPGRPKRPGLLAEVAAIERAFADSLADRRSDAAVEAILRLDRAIVEWSADTLQSDEPDRARSILHSLVHRLGEAAAHGLRDPREALLPLVDGLLALRAELRQERAWVLADRLRDRLLAAGIELRDTPGGTTWILRELS
jgi:cyanophycinase-like exopeptidase